MRDLHTRAVAYLALIVAMSGTAIAATGGTFILGRGNTADATTKLTSTGQVPLGLYAPPGKAPLAVNRSVRVNNLNADQIDGFSSEELQQRIASSCPEGQAMRGAAASGAPQCTVLAPPPPSGPVQSRDKQWAISDLQVFQEEFGDDFDGRVRITNESTATRTAYFTVTLFRSDGSVMATLEGNVSQVAPGNTYTADLFSSDTYSAEAYTATFQVDTSL